MDADSGRGGVWLGSTSLWLALSPPSGWSAKCLCVTIVAALVPPPVIVGWCLWMLSLPAWAMNRSIVFQCMSNWCLRACEGERWAENPALPLPEILNPTTDRPLLAQMERSVNERIHERVAHAEEENSGLQFLPQLQSSFIFMRL